MAYSHPSLQRVGPANSDAPTLWTYSSVDTAAVIGASGYFNAAYEDLSLGDRIFSNSDTDGTPTYDTFVVTTRAGGVIDVT